MGRRWIDDRGLTSRALDAQLRWQVMENHQFWKGKSMEIIVFHLIKLIVFAWGNTLTGCLEMLVRGAETAQNWLLEKDHSGFRLSQFVLNIS